MKALAFFATVMLGGSAAAYDSLDISGETENIIVKCPTSITFKLPVAYPQDGANAPSILRQSGGSIVNPDGYTENNEYHWPKIADVQLPHLSGRSVATRISEHPTNGTREYELSCAFGFTVKDERGFITDSIALTSIARIVRTRGECRWNSVDANFVCEPGLIPPAQQIGKKFQKGFDELVQKPNPN